jgi:hypothetical protein
MKQPRQHATRLLWVYCLTLLLMLIAGIALGGSIHGSCFLQQASPALQSGRSASSTFSAVRRVGVTTHKTTKPRQGSSQASSSSVALHYTNITEHPACSFFRSGERCRHSTLPG